MYPDRGIVHTYRWSEDLYTRPDEPNTLTRQSAFINDAPREPTTRICYTESFPDTDYIYTSPTSTYMVTTPRWRHDQQKHCTDA